MYVESKERFNWFDFFVKALIVVLFVFLLMWIVPLPGVKKVENKVNKLEEQIEVITDRVFFDNLENMKEAAKEYFTIPKLPKEVNGTVKLTLKEMLDKKLLLNITDMNGKTCDVNASYVELKRLNNEYEMKTYLKCDGVSDYIVSYMDLECNLSCSNECALTEKEQEYTMYQYKKVVSTTKWSNWSDWTTEVKKADDKKTKVQYKGKKWIENLVYEYDHVKTTTTADQTITTKEDDKVINVWVEGETKTCQKQVKVPYTAYETYYVTETQTEEQCKKVATGTKTVRDCATCALKTVTVYETICNDVEVEVEVEKTRPVTKYKYETQNYDCSTPGYFTQQTILGQTTTTVIPGETKTEKITTLNEKEEGYTMVAKRIKEDKGYYVYTENWVDKLESGYTQTEKRTLYSYRNKVTSKDTKYIWSRDPNLEKEGWTLVKTEVRTEKVSSK